MNYIRRSTLLCRQLREIQPLEEFLIGDKPVIMGVNPFLLRIRCQRAPESCKIAYDVVPCNLLEWLVIQKTTKIEMISDIDLLCTYSNVLMYNEIIKKFGHSEPIFG